MFQMSGRENSWELEWGLYELTGDHKGFHRTNDAYVLPLESG